MELIEPHVLQALAEVVGSDFVSDDIVIRQAYSRDPHPSITVRKMNKDPITIPDLIVLPSTTEEVQGVLRIANRYGINAIPMGSGENLTGYCVPSRSRTMIVDLKRMDKILEIDEENKVIRMQPWVSYSRVQAETMKRGLWNGGTPAAPASNNVISNCLFAGGDWQTSNAYGLGIRSILSFTVVLANGDIIRTGSHGITAGDPTYWYGPGPDLKGLWELGALGSLGIITEVLFKLHTWPGGEWPQEEVYGHPPLPKNHRVYWFRFDTPEQAIKAGHEITYSGIAIGVNLTMKSVDSLVGESHQALSVKRFDENYYEPHWMYIMLAGFSPRQLDYEEKILLEIIKEVGGEPLDEERKSHMDAFNQDCFRSGDFVRWIRNGIYAIVGFGRGPIEKMVEVHNLQQSVVTKYDVPSMNTTWPWYYSYERGYWWLDERDAYGDQLDYARTIFPMIVEVVRATDRNPSGYWLMGEPMGIWYGPKVGPNFHLMVRKIKQLFDPKDTMNPDKLSFMRPPEKKKKEEKEG